MAIPDALRALPVASAALDGEWVFCGPDGKSDFDRMRACFSRNCAPEAFLYAFDDQDQEPGASGDRARDADRDEQATLAPAVGLTAPSKRRSPGR